MKRRVSADGRTRPAATSASSASRASASATPATVATVSGSKSTPTIAAASRTVRTSGVSAPRSSASAATRRAARRELHVARGAAREPRRRGSGRGARDRTGCPRSRGRGGRASVGHVRRGSAVVARGRGVRGPARLRALAQRPGEGDSSRSEPGAARREREEDLGRGRAAQQRCDEVDGRRIGPVQVVEDHHERPFVASAASSERMAACTRWRSGAAATGSCARDGSASASDAASRSDRSGAAVARRAARARRSRRRAAGRPRTPRRDRTRPPRAAIGRPAPELLQQPGLADPGSPVTTSAAEPPAQRSSRTRSRTPSSASRPTNGAWARWLTARP